MCRQKYNQSQNEAEAKKQSLISSPNTDRDFAGGVRFVEIRVCRCTAFQNSEHQHQLHSKGRRFVKKACIGIRDSGERRIPRHRGYEKTVEFMRGTAFKSVDVDAFTIFFYNIRCRCPLLIISCSIASTFFILGAHAFKIRFDSAKLS